MKGSARHIALAAVTAAALMSVSGCGDGAPENADAATYRSLVAEYYRCYYTLASTQAHEPGTEFTDEEAGLLEARLRRVSLAWARARDDTLTLEGREFTYTYTAFEGLPKGTKYVNCFPVGGRRVVRGVWRRQNEEVVLQVLEVDGAVRAKPLEWVGTWRKDEIVLPWGFEMGPLDSDVILRRVMP